MKPDENEKCDTCANKLLKGTMFCIMMCSNYDMWEPKGSWDKLNSSEKSDE